MLQQLLADLHMTPIIPLELAAVLIVVIVVVLIWELYDQNKRKAE